MCPMMLLMINLVLQSPAPLMHQKQKDIRKQKWAIEPNSPNISLYLVICPPNKLLILQISNMLVIAGILEEWD